MPRLSVAFSLAFVAALLINLPGCGEQTEGFVYVDNGGSETITVEVDGENMGSVSASKFKKIRLDLGTHHFRISSGDEVIYDAQHTLDYGDRPFRRPTFILNPDNSNRYCEVSIVYGDDRFTQQSVDAMVTLISKAASKKAVGKDDDAKRLEWELDKKIKSKFRTTKHDLTAFGDEPFFRFETPHNILTPVPTVVRGSKYSSSTERSTLVRVPAEIHDFAEAALEVEEPTKEDLQRLITALEIVRELVPSR